MEIENAVSFVLAGKAYFALKSLRTNTVAVYYVTTSKNDKDKPVRFVYAKQKKSEGGRMAYIGTIFLDKKSKPFYRSNLSPLRGNDYRIIGFEWLWYRLVRGLTVNKAQMEHLGFCGRCGRKLIDPISRDRGLGPWCWRKTKKY